MVSDLLVKDVFLIVTEPVFGNHIARFSNRWISLIFLFIVKSDELFTLFY